MMRLLLMGCLAACSPRAVPDEKDHPADPRTPTAEDPPAAVSAGVDHREAFEQARPVFEKHCARCHKTGGKKASKKALEHFSLDAYPPGGHHAGEISARIRLVLGAGPGDMAASMPKDDPGAVGGDELAAILAWADAWDKTHEAHREGAHEHHRH